MTNNVSNTPSAAPKSDESNLLLLTPMTLRVGGAIAAVSLMKDKPQIFVTASIPGSTHVNGAYGRSSFTTLAALREVVDGLSIPDDKLLETRETARRVLEELKFTE